MCRAVSTPAMKSTVVKRPALRKRRRGERRVRFHAASESNHPLNENPFLSADEIEKAWYSRDEEHSFRLNAMKELCDYRRKNQYNLYNDMIESCPRGLERHTKERRMHKKELVKIIVLAHKSGFHPDDIALFSQQKSSWNMELARTQGSIDQIEVLLD